MTDKGKNKVQILHRINRLKLKAGAELSDKRAGFIDAGAIARAQDAIDSKEEEYGGELQEMLVKIDSVWTDMQTTKDEKKLKKLQDQMFNYANNVKDLAETYGYTLMKHFGQSMRDFCSKFDMNNEPHHIIMQAHIDVMNVAFEQGIKDDGGPAAKELMQIVVKAIEKHS